MTGVDARIRAKPIVVHGSVNAGGQIVSILWIILIIVLVLIVLGFFGRGRF